MSKEEAQAIPTADGDDDGRWEQDVADEGTENSRAKASSTDPLAATAGNPVFNPAASMRTSDLYATANLPDRFNNPDSFKGYGTGKGGQNPVYMTSSSDYGMFAPNPHTMPKAFHGLNQKFSQHQGQAGMSRTTGLNTAVDRSRVHGELKP